MTFSHHFSAYMHTVHLSCAAFFERSFRLRISRVRNPRISIAEPLLSYVDAYSIFDNFGIHSGLPGNLSPSTRASLMRKCIANLVELAQDNDPSVVEID